MLPAAVESYAAHASYMALWTINSAREATVGALLVALIALTAASFHWTAAFAVPSARLFAGAGSDTIRISTMAAPR